jgi:hypothetical protein
VVGSYGASDAEIGVGSRVSLDPDQLWGRVAESGDPERTDRLRKGSDALAESLLAVSPRP